MEKHKGGRPSYYHDVLKRFIPAAIVTMSKARPSDLMRMWERDIKKNISINTIRRYCEELVKDGVLSREVEIDNNGSGNRSWQMVWYKLQ